MSRSNRGAARVSVIWIIVTGVLALATTAFAFISQGDMTRANNNLAAAKAEEKKARDAFVTVNTARQQAVERLGFYDRASADPIADLAAADESIQAARATWPDISATVKSLEEIIPVAKAAKNRQDDAIAALKAEVARLNAELASKGDALAAVTNEKSSKIQELTRQNADLQANFDARQQDQQSTIDATRSAVADNDQKVRNLAAEMATQEAQFTKIADLNAARNKSLMNDIKIRAHEDSLRSDGKILDVANGLGKAWINRGSDDRLTVGTVFDIYGSQGGLEVLKAVGQVTKIVNGKMAELRLRNYDRTDPVVNGDSIVNPFYDPNQERHAVLIGEFASKDELIAGLSRMNIVVDDALGLLTRLVIIGGPQRVDPETGDALEEERQPEDMDEFKQAVAQNLQMMTVGMLREYFPQTL